MSRGSSVGVATGYGLDYRMLSGLNIRYECCSSK